MERSHGEEGVEGKCRKYKGHDLWYMPVQAKTHTLSVIQE